MPKRDDAYPISVRVTVERRDAWDAAAKACGMSRQAWMAAILDAASGYGELPEHMARVRWAKR